MPVAECRSDEALARLMQGDEDGTADSPPASASSSAAHGKRKKGLACTEPAAASASKVVRRAGSVAAELASIIPFARGIDRQQPELHLAQLPENLLVSASTYRVLTWGKDGHRKILHAYAPKLCYEAAMHSELCYKAARCSGEISATICDVPFTEKDVAAYRHEWDQLPYCVPDGVSVPLEAMEQDALHVAKVGRWTAGASSATCLTPTTCSSSSGAPVAFVENSQQPVESSEDSSDESVAHGELLAKVHTVLSTSDVASTISFSDRSLKLVGKITPLSTSS